MALGMREATMKRMLKRARRSWLPEADETNGTLPLFVWGAVTALALWWLYLRPASTERKLARLGGRLKPRLYKVAGGRPGIGRATLPASPAADPVTLTPAAPAQPDDDLTRILGIGPARAARLRAAGLTTFAALAVADAEQLRDILAGVRVGAADMSSWPEQASLAAKGDWDGLEALQDRLRAERA